jgi:hypothetical protein
MLNYNRLIATWNEFVQEFPDVIDLREFDILREDAYIRKVGKEWCIFSEDGDNLGCKGSKKEAEDRLAEIEMFKHMKSSTHDSASRYHFCICQNCGVEFAATKYCDETKCPACGEYKGMDVEDLEEMEGSDKTVAKQECFCEECHTTFWTRTTCEMSSCPNCGADGDSLEELTGII